MGKMINFEADALLLEASQRSGGLTDFGDESFRPALQAMLKSLNEEAKLSDTGRHLLRQRIVELLSNRLQVEDYCKRYPSILEESIEKPIVIVGLPRTGTTLLQRVLSCDPRFYPMLWWESRHPVPLADAVPGQADPRIDLARQEVRMMVEAMPQLLTIHPLDAEQADEEVMLMEHSFYAAMDAFADVPGYMAWQARQDHTPAYAYLKKLLQFLQWQKRQRGVTAERWVLKTPNHLHTMAALFKVFPDAQVIQTHRDPLQTIPSLCSFIHTLWAIYSDQADAAAVGRHWSAKMANALSSATSVRDRMPSGHFHDVWFRDTVSRPMEVIKAIYGFIGMPLTDVAERAMQQWLADNRRDKRATHEYSAAQFGLSEEQLMEAFSEYRQRYVLADGGAARA
ncbi:MAG: sulfotransferase family protein [Noviherbaspirillum sp.]